jgi:hypothetical protein
MSNQKASRLLEWIVPPVVVPALVIIAILIAAWMA